MFRGDCRCGGSSNKNVAMSLKKCFIGTQKILLFAANNCCILIVHFQFSKVISLLLKGTAFLALMSRRLHLINALQALEGVKKHFSIERSLFVAQNLITQARKQKAKLKNVWL